MPKATRDFIDRIAPPPPRERWRWLLYAALVIAIVVVATGNRGNGGAFAAQSWEVTPDGDAHAVTLRVRHGTSTITGVHSRHEAVTVLAVGGLPQRSSGEDPLIITLRLKVACDLLFVNSNPTLRLDADEPFWRDGHDDVSLQSLTAPGGPICP